MGLLGKPIPAYLTAIADEFGDEIPCAPYVDNQADHIGQAIMKYKNKAPAIIMGHHGTFAWGPTPRAALKAAVMLEDVSQDRSPGAAARQTQLAASGRSARSGGIDTTRGTASRERRAVPSDE